MSQPDDLDKLLREIEAMNAPAGTGAVAEPGAKDVARQGEPVDSGRGRRSPAPRPTRGGRLAWTGAGAVGGLVTGGVVGTVLAVLPYVSTLSTAVGAALGGAVVGFVSGPPRWFDDGE